MTIVISADAIAWYGAVVATFSGIFSVYEIIRDRAKLKIKYSRNTQILNYPAYDSTKKYLTISVVNRGRRPIRIGSVSLKIFGNSHFTVLNDSLLNLRNKILTEENPETCFFIEENILVFDDVIYISVYDGVGKEYKKYTRLLPSFWVMWQKIKFF